MRGKYPTGMYVVQSECVDSNQRDAFVDWFTTVRIPDLIGTGWVTNGALFENIESEGNFTPGRFLSLHETERWDMEDMLDEIPGKYEVEWAKNQTENPHYRGVSSRLFRRCGPPWRPEISGFTTDKSGVAPVTGLVVMTGTYRMIDREQPVGHRGIDAGENEYNIWYCRSYIPQVMKTAPFHTAYRYACVNKDDDGRRQFLTLYETDSENPVATTTEFLREWKSAETRNTIVEEQGYSIYRPVP